MIQFILLAAKEPFLTKDRQDLSSSASKSISVMELRADLHIHTIASDGALTSTEVVKAASEAGLAAIAITDHDTVDGVREAVEAGEEFGVEVVPGVEISTMHEENIEVHILGYFIDYHGEALLAQLRTLKDARWERGKMMVELLNVVGVPVDFERVAEIARGGAVGRPHVARAICEVGAASSMDSAYGRFLQTGGPAYVPRFKLTPAEAVRLICEAGGVACCAHAAKLKRDELLVGLIDQGLQAIEAWHPDHTSSMARFYKKFAHKRGLIATGGSDAHCLPYNRRAAIGDVTVPYEVVLELKRAAGK